MSAKRLKWAGNIVRIFEKKIKKMASTWKSWREKNTKWGRIQANYSTRGIRNGEGCRQISQQEEYEVGKDAAKFLNKKDAKWGIMPPNCSTRTVG
jgi:hypothetical protein